MLLSWEVPESTRQTIRQIGINARGLRGALLRSAKFTAEMLAIEVQIGLTGERLKTASGSLKRAVAGRAKIRAGEIEIGVGVTKGPATAYAKKQEEGGRVKAKAGKALPVPLDPVRRRWAVPKSPSELPGNIKLFMLKREGKPPLLCKEIGGKGRKLAKGKGRKGYAFEPWYVLVKSVNIPASHWLSGPIEQHAPRIVPRMIEQALDRQLKDGGG